MIARGEERGQTRRGAEDSVEKGGIERGGRNASDAVIRQAEAGHRLGRARSGQVRMC